MNQRVFSNDGSLCPIISHTPYNSDQIIAIDL